MWLLSTEAESATLGLVVGLLVLWLLLAPPARVADSIWYELLLGLAVSLAVLTYLSGAMLIVIVASGLLLGDVSRGRSRVKSLIRFAGPVAVICLPVALATLAYRSWLEWRNIIWQDDGQGYLAMSWSDGLHGIYAFLRSFGLFVSLALDGGASALLESAGNGLKAVFAGYYGLLLAVVLMPFYLAIRRWTQIMNRWRREVIILLMWMAGYAAFAIYWVPGDVTFWLPVLTGWWLLTAIVAKDRMDLAQKKQAASDRSAVQWLAIALVTFVLWLIISNGVFAILPRNDLSSNDAYQLAMEVRSQTSMADLIVTNSNDIETLYLVYFGRRTVLPVADETPDPDYLEREYADFFSGTAAAGGRNFLLLDNALIQLTP
jgi:hypothetical protein